MAIGIREFTVPPITGVARAARTIQLPQGATVLALFQPPGDAPRLIVQGDSNASLEDRGFSAVRQGVALTAAEQAGAYVGSMTTYWTETGIEVYHLFALPTP